MVKCHLKAGRNTLLYTNFTIAPEIEDSGNCVPGVLPHFLYMDFLKRLDEGCLLLLIEVFNDTVGQLAYFPFQIFKRPLSQGCQIEMGGTLILWIGLFLDETTICEPRNRPGNGSLFLLEAFHKLFLGDTGFFRNHLYDVQLVPRDVSLIGFKLCKMVNFRLEQIDVPAQITRIDSNVHRLPSFLYFLLMITLLSLYTTCIHKKTFYSEIV